MQIGYSAAMRQTETRVCWVDALPVTLQQFLKLADIVSSGGEAKWRIGEGEVRVNGAVELRRSRKLQAGDQVAVDGIAHVLRVSIGAAPEGVEDEPLDD